MGVHIPNMEMPKSCWGCELLSSCKAMPKNPTTDEIGIYTVMRLKDCSLIEIVRCWECKWYGVSDGMPYCDWWLREIEPDGFCSYGERRTDDKQIL